MLFSSDITAEFCSHYLHWKIWCKMLEQKCVFFAKK